MLRILFAAPEDAWGGFLHAIRAELPEHRFEASGSLAIHSLKGFDVLVPTMSTVSRELLEESDRLRLIQQCGTGLERVDIETAWRLNIWVANVPTTASGSADSVAELGVYFMIGLSRDFRGMGQSLREGRMGEPVGRALSGKTVGIIGLGGIGKALARKLQAFNMRVMGIKRSSPRECMRELGLDWAGSPEEVEYLLRNSDYVVLCLPLTPETMYFMNRETLAAMKTDAFLVNLGRGRLVDRRALEESLASGGIAGAGLDVFWDEPPDPNDPIFRYNVLATPHIGGVTDLSVRGVVRVVAENIRRIESNLEPKYCVSCDI